MSPFHWYSSVASSATRFGGAITNTHTHTYIHTYVHVNAIARYHHVPGADEPDSQSDPSAAVVRFHGHRFSDGRHPALRRGLRGALLHHVGAVAAPDLLHLRVGSDQIRSDRLIVSECFVHYSISV